MANQMKKIEKARINEIVTLHGEVKHELAITLPKAIRIGKLLIKQKASLEHGEWLPWIEKNLPFSDQTARNYMKMFKRRREFENQSILNLTDAHRALLPGPVDKDEQYKKQIAEALKIQDVAERMSRLTRIQMGLAKELPARMHDVEFNSIGYGIVRERLKLVTPWPGKTIIGHIDLVSGLDLHFSSPAVFIISPWDESNLKNEEWAERMLADPQFNLKYAIKTFGSRERIKEILLEPNPDFFHAVIVTPPIKREHDPDEENYDSWSDMFYRSVLHIHYMQILDFLQEFLDLTKTRDIYGGQGYPEDEKSDTDTEVTIEPMPEQQVKYTFEDTVMKEAVFVEPTKKRIRKKVKNTK